MDNVLEVENVGPIEKLSVKFAGHGVTVVEARNGAGKSIFLDSVQKLAAGKGKLTLKDGEESGSLEGFGAKVTIGKNTRHGGECEIVNLEGKFDLADLVDPKIDSPPAADRKRIKALVGLTGVKADAQLFRNHKSFADFDAIVPEAVKEATDLVEMASKTKKAYEAAAQKKEETAEREMATAKALDESVKDLDFGIEDDEAILAADHQAATAFVVRIVQEIAVFNRVKETADKAKSEVEALQAKQDGKTVAQCQTVADDKYGVWERHQKEFQELADKLSKLQEQLGGKRHEMEVAEGAYKTATAELKAANAVESAYAEKTAIIFEFSKHKAPDESALAAAKQAADDASFHMIEGGKVRDGHLKKKQAETHRAEYKKATKQAEEYRATAASVDDVLSKAIKCEELSIKTIGEETRIVVPGHQRGPTTCYHELSEGERWRIAIILGAHQVGEDGLLVVPQHAWESLDVFVRDVISSTAKETKVYVLTAEAQRNRDQEETFATHSYAGTLDSGVTSDFETSKPKPKPRKRTFPN